MENDVLSIYNEDYLKSKIYVIRGVQVMIDRDLAKIYGYETKNFNRQIKNNIERFDEDMRFQLTNNEYYVLRCNFCTTKISTTNCESINCNETSVLMCKNFTSSWGGTRYLPYAFTEQGVYMLMTVLKGDLAVSQSKKLIRLFKRMKDFVVQIQNVLPASEIGMLSIQTRANTEDIRLIKEQMVTHDELTMVIEDFTDHEIKKDYLFYNGETVEADMAYSEIYSYAKKSIHIIDNYIGLKTLLCLFFLHRDVLFS